MANNTVAVNENEINSMILNITNSSDTLRRLFNEIFDLAESSSSCCDCTAINIWKSNISQLKDDCNNVINNLSSYKDDLVKIKMLHYDEMVELSRKIQSKAIVENEEYL